jgi:agmatine deiminase
LGVTQVIWLGKGVVADETSGHVDNLCCFVKPGEVALTWTDDKKDPQYRVSADAYERLSGARDARGRKLKIHKIPHPGPLQRTAAESRGIDASEGTAPRQPGERLAASYVNFYIANSTVVMPLLDPKKDAAAAKVIKALFPERRVIGVQAREILLGGGNIHCITQQVPRVHTAAASPAAAALKRKARAVAKHR